MTYRWIIIKLNIIIFSWIFRKCITMIKIILSFIIKPIRKGKKSLNIDSKLFYTIIYFNNRTVGSIMISFISVLHYNAIDSI